MGQRQGESTKWKWHRGTLPAKSREQLTATGVAAEPEHIWLNELYEVWIRPTTWGDGSVPMVWLSIKRRDKQPIRSWRHLQRIKNELVGPECEGFELFPAESRLADAANQFHIFCFSNPEVRLPLGFSDRLVLGPEEAAQVGAVQAPFEDD